MPDLGLTTNAPVLELPDGSRQILYLSLDQTHFISANRYRADCACAGMAVTSPDGMRYEMTTPVPESLQLTGPMTSDSKEFCA